jgi:hypothetical protein
MSEKHDQAYGIQRLESKTAKAAIIQKISSDFNLTLLIAEAYYKQISTYFEQHADVKLTSGQICYEAVAADEPAGKHIALARKISCRLTLNDTNSDFEILANYGLAGLRRHRIRRLTREAYDQGALLSYEDLAIMLTTSPSTVKRDIRHLKHSGKFVMTRGAKHDMGPGISHKTQIIELYLKGYQFTEIEQKTNHSERAVYRYLRDFSQVCILHQQGYPNAQIRIITNLSDKIIREYLPLLSEYSLNERVSTLLNPEQFFSKKKESSDEQNPDQR